MTEQSLTVSALSETVREWLPVATMADLRLLRDPNATRFVELLGYYTKGDGGGGSFYWNDSSTSSDNGGTVILPTGHSGAGRWVRVVNDGVYRAAQFGAIVGQSAATITAAGNAAIDAAEAAGGGIVEFPEGSFEVNASLATDGTKDIWLRGQGWSTIITTSTASCIPIDFGDTSADRTADIRVTDLRVTGAAGTSHGIRFKRLHNVRIENVRVNNMGGNGVELDRCYATWFDRVYSNNNTGSGFHAGPYSTVGNDMMIFENCRALANGAKGFHIEEACDGTVFTRCDMEGNAIGLQVDGGANLTSVVGILQCYFENQTGANVSIAEDAGAARVDCVEFIGNVVNPGTVSAATNCVAFGDVQVARISGNHFSTSNVTASSSIRQLLGGPNKYSSCSGPFASSEPIQFMVSAVGAALNVGFKAVGNTTYQRVGTPYAGNKLVLSNNLLMTGDAAGTQDDTSAASSAIMVGPNAGRIVRCAAGGGASLSLVLRWDAGGNFAVGNGAPATNATDGFLYVPACAGTPTGAPTAFTGLAPIVVDSTNNKLYFYSGGAWRDAGP